MKQDSLWLLALEGSEQTLSLATDLGKIEHVSSQSHWPWKEVIHTISCYWTRKKVNQKTTSLVTDLDRNMNLHSLYLLILEVNKFSLCIHNRKGSEPTLSLATVHGRKWTNTFSATDLRNIQNTHFGWGCWPWKEVNSSLSQHNLEGSEPILSLATITWKEVTQYLAIDHLRLWNNILSVCCLGKKWTNPLSVRWL